MNFAWPLYRRLAEAFPHEFKLAFGDEMMQAGEAAIAIWPSATDRRPPPPDARSPSSPHRIPERDAPRPALRRAHPDEVARLRPGWHRFHGTRHWADDECVQRRLGSADTNAAFSGECKAVWLTPENTCRIPTLNTIGSRRSLFAGVAAVENPVAFNVALRMDSTRIPSVFLEQLVSPDYFSVLGIQAAAGTRAQP